MRRERGRNEGRKTDILVRKEGRKEWEEEKSKKIGRKRKRIIGEE